MKKKAALILMFVIVSASLYFTGMHTGKAHDYGAPAGYTNSPFDGKSCAASGCHSTYNLQAKKPWITSWVPGTGYLPDSVYTIIAKAVYEGHTSFGFEISPQTVSGAPMGTLIATNPTTTSITTSGSLQYIEQTINGYQGHDSLVWVFQWKAPSGQTDSVTFYGCFNCGSGTSASSGIIYPATLTVYQQYPAGIKNVKNQSTAFTIFPNPAKEQIAISYNLKQSGNIEVNLYSCDGREIANLCNNIACEGNNTQTIKLPASINPGMYFIQVIADGESSVQRVIKE